MTYKVLSIDGGGMRGIIPAIWLDCLETKLGKPLADCFNLIAGTSTGSLLACGIALGIPAKAIIEVYRTMGPTIFPPRQACQRLRAWRKPRYNPEGLRKVLEDRFSDILFNALPRRTLVTAYETETGSAILFDSGCHVGWAAKIQADMTVADVCLASCSAPIVFPSHVVPFNGGKLSLVDGGVIANNPSLLALGRARRTGANLDDIVLASFGTGETVEQLRAEDAQQMGTLGWAPRIVPFIFDGNADGVHIAATDLVHPGNYYRFQTKLYSKQAKLDNVDPKNLADLQRVALLYLQEGNLGALAMSSLVREVSQ